MSEIDGGSPPYLQGVVPLWFDEFYDGPEDGVAVYEGEVRYFDRVDPASGERPRVYALWETSPAWLEIDRDHQRAFLDLVGYPNDPRPSELHQDFWSREEPPPAPRIRLLGHFTWPDGWQRFDPPPR